MQYTSQEDPAHQSFSAVSVSRSDDLKVARLKINLVSLPLVRELSSENSFLHCDTHCAISDDTYVASTMDDPNRQLVWFGRKSSPRTVMREPPAAGPVAGLADVS